MITERIEFFMIYITGDTHGLHDSNKLNTIPASERDYIIITGDFGFLWKDEPDKREEDSLYWLHNLDPDILFIDGNHENFNRLNNLPSQKMFKSDVGIVKDGIYHLKRGRVYQIEDKAIFTFGGALSIDKNIRQENISWWPEEIPSQQEFETAIINLKKYDFKVDYIISHTAPASITNIIVNNTKFDPTEGYLEEIKQRTEFKKWFFGHYHVDKKMGYYISLYHEYVRINK